MQENHIVVYLSVSQSVSQSGCLSVYPSNCLSVCLSHLNFEDDCQLTVQLGTNLLKTTMCDLFDAIYFYSGMSFEKKCNAVRSK